MGRANQVHAAPDNEDSESSISTDSYSDVSPRSPGARAPALENHGSMEVYSQNDVYEVTFQPGSIGIGLLGNSVVTLVAGGQGKTLGVREGSFFRRVNGIPYTEDVLDRAIASKEPFKVVFELPRSALPWQSE